MENIPLPNTNDKKIIIFIMGTSAVGKTKLSLSLANTLKNCEIVNCDSMQLYKDANIMTAKATKDEQLKIKHHLLDILDVSVNNFTRTSFIEIGVKLIDDLFKQGVIPIIVGGTHYYLEGLLFQDNELFQDHESSETETATNEEITTLEDYNLLKEIDPVMANKIHPNDKRKIRNYLMLYNKHKILPSEMVKKSESERKLRYENSIILWPLMQKSQVLKEKARLRIEEMVKQEGIKEIISIYEYFCFEIQEVDELEKKLDFTRGILQAIGYKEFFLFYKEIKKILLKLNLSFKKILNNEKETDDFLKYIQDDITIQDKLSLCKERLLMKTIKYTKKQLLWIENRLLTLPVLENRIFKFGFNSYDSGEFEKSVLFPACKILANYKSNLNLKILKKDFDNYVISEIELKNNSKRTALEEWKKFHCEICNYDFNGPKEWEIHLSSKKHTKKKEKLKRKEKEKENNFKKKELKKENQQENKDQNNEINTSTHDLFKEV